MPKTGSILKCSSDVESLLSSLEDDPHSAVEPPRMPSLSGECFPKWLSETPTR